MSTQPTGPKSGVPAVLPGRRELFYGGAWKAPLTGGYAEISSPGSGAVLGSAAVASEHDALAAVDAARAAFRSWSRTPPAERARLLREMAAVIAAHADELAMIDAIDCGNPVRETIHDVHYSVAVLEFFAGMVTEMKGTTIPMGEGCVNLSLREPLGVVAKILAYNHPLAFCVGRAAAPLAAGNTVILKPAEQAPLSALRVAEIVGDMLPPGVLNVITGGVEAGAALARHRDVAKVGLTGSIGAGRAVLAAAAGTIKPVSLELGGKNALIAFPDADPARVANALVAGMNLAWCGQSCGSTSRAFIHDSLHDAVLDEVRRRFEAICPGLPTDRSTAMGALISLPHLDRVTAYVDSGLAQGARLVCGGRRPDAPELAAGFYFEPTIFADVTPSMRIAREEIFGPVLCFLRWDDEAAMFADVNALDYGLTCSIWTNDLSRAHRAAAEVEAGYIWINGVSKHFPGASFGGYKQSGMGREEGLEELLSHTQEKNVNINLI